MRWCSSTSFAFVLLLIACVPSFRSIVDSPRVAGEMSRENTPTRDVEIWLSLTGDCKSRSTTSRTNKLGRFDFAERRTTLIFETIGDRLHTVDVCTSGSAAPVSLWSTGWVGSHESIAPYWLRCTGHDCEEVAPLW